MKKITLILILLFNISFVSAHTEENFKSWLKEFKLVAVKSGVSQKTVNYSYE